MKVSVIVPVYNVEKYLSRCVESLLAQNYTDLEIILVDDGSKDNSGKMCDVYSGRDKRISVIHKKNEGLSSARNAGMDVASGDAIFFLDSDDYLSEDCIAKCVELLDQYDADVSIVQMVHVSETTNEVIRIEQEAQTCLMNSGQAIAASLYQKIFTCCAPAKLYKRNVLGDVRFPVGRISEDLATCHLFLSRAPRVVYSNHYGYFYRQRENSIMHVFNPKRMDALEWALEIEKFCSKYYPEIKKAAVCRTFNVAIHLLLDLPAVGEVHNQYGSMVWKEIKRTRIQTIINRNARNREKIAALLSFTGEKGLRFAWNSRFVMKTKEKTAE